MSRQPARHRDDAVERYRRHVLTEWDAAALYRGLADLSRGRRREVLTELADIEDEHAAFWSGKIRDRGGRPPDLAEFSPSERTRSLLDRARRFTPDIVLPLVEQDERDAVDAYGDEPDAPASMIADEEGHARALGELIRSEGIRAEPWHRTDKSGTLRAAIFGINDGLVSNTSLVMGFAGAAVDRSTVLLAGITGLLAGAFSMGSGEYISMANQRESYERELAFEREEIALRPDAEKRELQLLYEAKGVRPETAREMAEQVFADPDAALDTLAREELGLDPDDLGSPWGAAMSSFSAFSLGAVLPVVPYLFAEGRTALLLAIALAVLALVAVGGGMARVNARPPLPAIVRQVLFGGCAAAVTYGLGTLFGVAAG